MKKLPVIDVMPLANKAGATGLPTMDIEGEACTILQTGYVSQGWTHMVKSRVGRFILQGWALEPTAELDRRVQNFISFITSISFFTINHIHQQMQTIGLQSARNLLSQKTNTQ